VSQLGSIFEPDTGAGPRGRDLRAEVTVPAWACGHPDGYAVAVARELPALGGYARRAVGHDEGDLVHLRLPAGFPEGGVLRLRGQGEVLSEDPTDGPANGPAGDLLLTVHIDLSQRSPPGGALTWSPGQALTTGPDAPRNLVLLVVLVFAAGAVAIALL
jgi:hypothetical protein